MRKRESDELVLEMCNVGYLRERADVFDKESRVMNELMDEEAFVMSKDRLCSKKWEAG